jgi:hypothetical protein
MRGTGIIALLVLCTTIASCAKDEVQPDVGGDAICGDGVVEAGEACDNSSQGCVDCQVAAGWICTNNTCKQTCGDGIVGTGSSCTNPHRDTDCDMTGYWTVSETDYTCDDAFHQPQTSSNWYLYHITQSGNSFQVDEELDCGVHVTGSVTVDYTPAALKALMYQNQMDGTGSHPARKGVSTSTSTGGGCTFSLDRWYKVAGVEETYLPADFSTLPPLSALPPLPTVSDTVNGADDPPGATDPQGDGFAGIAVQITGIVDGVRHSAQRNWKQYATTSTPVPAAALRFDVPGNFDLQESILHVSQCGTSCALLTTGAMASTAPGKITFSFLGKTLTSSHVAAVVAGPPRKNVQDDLTTCKNVQLALPHETMAPANACMSSL